MSQQHCNIKLPSRNELFRAVYGVDLDPGHNDIEKARLRAAIDQCLKMVAELNSTPVDDGEGTVTQRTDAQREADGSAAAKEAAAIARDCEFCGVANVTEGERWYAMLPGSPSLHNVIVHDVTKHTVKVGIPRGYSARYERTAVIFVEQILPEPPQA